MAKRYLQLLFCAALLLVGVALCFPGYAQNVYYGPKEPPHFEAPLPGTTKKVKVQIQVYDSSDLSGPKIIEASFNGKSIVLGPSDIRGYRGAGSFQVPVGKYNLVWRVTNDNVDWPRTLKYQQTVQVTPNDTWIQIIIQGDKANTV